MNKKNLFAAVAATAMAMTMSVSAFAADANTTGTVGGVIPTDNGTDVYAGVVVDDKDTRIEKAVSEIGVLNAGKKRDEILEMVGPYFSRLEKHLGQMKKYQATIDYLTQENEGLKEKANSEKSIQKQMEVLMLKKENEQLRRFVQRIPPEVRQALKEQQQGQRRDKDRQR